MKFLKNKRVKSIFLLVLLCSLLVGCDFNKNKDSNQSHRGNTNSSGVYIKKDNNKKQNSSNNHDSDSEKHNGGYDDSDDYDYDYYNNADEENY